MHLRELACLIASVLPGSLACLRALVCLEAPAYLLIPVCLLSVVTKER